MASQGGVSEYQDDMDYLDSSLEELQQIALDTCAKSKATAKATETGMKKFNRWLETRNLNCDWATISAERLNGVLKRFYTEVKHHKPGVALAPSSLVWLRAAIHRYIIAPPYSRPINIMRDKEFMMANAVFNARCKQYHFSEQKTEIKTTIDEADLEKLRCYFSVWRTIPDVMMETVWFFLCHHFGRRSREGWTAMTRNSVQVGADPSGHEYLSVEPTPFHKNTHKHKKRVYGDGVDMFKLYVSKLNPECNRLFQTPLKNFMHDEHWYKREGLGKNSMSVMTQRISKKAGLSYVYTSHAVTASNVETLFQHGVPGLFGPPISLPVGQAIPNSHFFPEEGSSRISTDQSSSNILHQMKMEGQYPSTLSDEGTEEYLGDLSVVHIKQEHYDSEDETSNNSVSPEFDVTDVERPACDVTSPQPPRRDVTPHRDTAPPSGFTIRYTLDGQHLGGGSGAPNDETKDAKTGTDRRRELVIPIPPGFTLIGCTVNLNLKPIDGE